MLRFHHECRRTSGYCRRKTVTALRSVVRSPESLSPYSALEATPIVRFGACVRETVSMLGLLTGAQF